MSLASFSGRVRNRPNNASIQFSSSPISLPNGLITVHSPYCNKECYDENNNNDDDNDNDIKDGSNNDDASSTSKKNSIYKKSLNIFNLVEINYACFGYIIDHCWTSINVKPSTSCDNNDQGDNTNQHIILAVLSRSMQHNNNNLKITTESNNIDDKSNNNMMSSSNGVRGGGGSVVKLFHCENNNQSMKFSSSSSYGQELVNTIYLNSYNNCVAMNEHILVVGGSSGIIIYNLKGGLLKEIIFNDDDANNISSLSLDEINLTPSIPVLSLHINCTYLIAASVDSIRIWNVNRIINYMQDPTIMSSSTSSCGISSLLLPIWVHKLNNLERITCVDMTNDYKFLSISCWDGKVFVFKEKNLNWLPYNPGSLWENPCQVRLIIFFFYYMLIQ